MKINNITISVEVTPAIFTPCDNITPKDFGDCLRRIVRHPEGSKHFHMVKNSAEIVQDFFNKSGDDFITTEEYLKATTPEARCYGDVAPTLERLKQAGIIQVVGKLWKGKVLIDEYPDGRKVYKDNEINCYTLTPNYLNIILTAENFLQQMRML